MVKEDARIIYNTYLSYNWNPGISTYLNYDEETLQNKRKVFIAVYKGDVKWLFTMVLEPEDWPYGRQGIPEIVGFCVFLINITLELEAGFLMCLKMRQQRFVAGYILA